MKRTLRMTMLALAAVVAASAVIAWTHHGGSGSGAAPVQAGYRVYIDPATGGITSQPTDWGPVVVDPDVKNALDTSSQGLHEEPSPVPGGGVMVRLDGRFQNVEMAAIGPGGKLVVPCVSGLPADETPKPETPSTGGARHEDE